MKLCPHCKKEIEVPISTDSLEKATALRKRGLSYDAIVRVMRARGHQGVSFKVLQRSLKGVPRGDVDSILSSGVL